MTGSTNAFRFDKNNYEFLSGELRIGKHLYLRS
jgi:hypothetical protein